MNDKLMTALQNGIEPVARPFIELAKGLGLTERELVDAVNTEKSSGIIRRFGAVFDSTALGFRSTLCAVDIPQAELKAFAAKWDAMPSITHVYIRDFSPAVWFTMTAKEDVFEVAMQSLQSIFAPHKMLELPALKKFKIHAVFGEDAYDYEAPPAPQKINHALQPIEMEMVRLFQGDLEITAEPFKAAANKLGISEDELLRLLKDWKSRGIIHRIGAICRHRQMGYNGNAMCVWNVAPEKLDSMGRLLAKSQKVSHCCQRRSSKSFPFNLYGMLHAKDPAAVDELFKSLSGELGLGEGRMLRTKAELKKTSPVFY